jgi:kynurenine formamidase
MCAPSLISAVREELSRRHFLGVLGGAVSAISVTGAAQTSAKPVRLAKGFRDTFDLTHTLSSSTPVYPAFRSMEYVQKFTIAKDGFGCGELTFNEHTGTHMDAPVHFVAGKSSVDRLPIDAHLTVLGAGKYGVEVMANLAAVPAAGATVIVGAPKHLGGTGGPVRLYAVA